MSSPWDFKGIGPVILGRGGSKGGHSKKKSSEPLVFGISGRSGELWAFGLGECVYVCLADLFRPAVAKFAVDGGPFSHRQDTAMGL